MIIYQIQPTKKKLLMLAWPSTLPKNRRESLDRKPQYEEYFDKR